MKEHLVPYDTAVELKAKGFNPWCRKYYFEDGPPTKPYHWNGTEAEKRDKESLVYANTLSLAAKWLRDVHDIYMDTEHYVDRHFDVTVIVNIKLLKDMDNEKCRFHLLKSLVYKGDKWEEKALSEAVNKIGHKE